MADFDWTKPTVGGSSGTWGTEINGILDVIKAHPGIKVVADADAKAAYVPLLGQVILQADTGVLYKCTNATGPVWAEIGPAATADSTLTTKGDLLVYGSALSRLGVGTNGQVLTADSAQALGVKWAAANGIPEGGTAGQVLAKVDGTNYNAQWIDAPSGGGAAYLNIIDKPPINPSNWDDEFNDNTVSGWTWLNQGISAVAEEQEESFLKIRVPSQGSADLIRGLVKTCPTGNFQATLKFIDCSRYGSWPKLGIVIGESLSGKQLFCAFRAASSNTAQTTYEVFTNPNTRASTQTGDTLSSYFGFYVRTKVYLDDTTWKVEISYSTRGIAWNIFRTVSLDFTPTYIGVAVNNAGTPTSDTSYYFGWFRVVEI